MGKPTEDQVKHFIENVIGIEETFPTPNHEWVIEKFSRHSFRMKSRSRLSNSAQVNSFVLDLMAAQQSIELEVGKKNFTRREGKCRLELSANVRISTVK